MKKLLCWVVILCLLVCLAGCGAPVEEEDIVVGGTKVTVTQEIWMEQADLVMKAQVLERRADYHTDPDGKNDAVVSARVTEYVLRVLEVYKGEYTEDTILVKTYNDVFLTEQEAAKAESEILPVEMQTGECVVGLSRFDAAAFGEGECYELTYGLAGYFLPTADGVYENQTEGSNHFSIRVDELKK